MAKDQSCSQTSGRLWSENPFLKRTYKKVKTIHSFNKWSIHGITQQLIKIYIIDRIVLLER